MTKQRESTPLNGSFVRHDCCFLYFRPCISRMTHFRDRLNNLFSILRILVTFFFLSAPQSKRNLRSLRQLHILRGHWPVSRMLEVALTSLFRQHFLTVDAKRKNIHSRRKTMRFLKTTPIDGVLSVMLIL